MPKPLNEFGGWLKFFYVQAWCSFVILTGFGIYGLLMFPKAITHFIFLPFWVALELCCMLGGSIDFMKIKIMRITDPLVPQKLIRLTSWNAILMVMCIVFIVIFYHYVPIKYISEAGVTMYFGMTLIKILLWLCIFVAYFRKSERVSAYYGVSVNKFTSLQRNILKIGLPILFISLFIIEYYPHLSEFNYAKGYKYWQQGKYDDAVVELNKAISIDPNNAQAYFFRGLIHSKKGDLDQAISDYDKAINLSPNYAKAYNNRGWDYFRKGNFDLAIADCTKSIEILPKRAAPYYNKGLAYYSLGQFDKALADYKRALEIKFHEGAYKEFLKFVPQQNSLDTTNIRQEIINLFKEKINQNEKN